jgi:hypothetical protein
VIIISEEFRRLMIAHGYGLEKEAYFKKTLLFLYEIKKKGEGVQLPKLVIDDMPHPALAEMGLVEEKGRNNPGIDLCFYFINAYGERIARKLIQEKGREKQHNREEVETAGVPKKERAHSRLLADYMGEN